MSRIVFNDYILMPILDELFYDPEHDFMFSYDELVELQNLELATGVYEK